MCPRHPKEGFRGDGVFFHTMHVQVAITGRGHGHLFERVELCTSLEISHEREASLFQESYIAFAVHQEFGLKVKDDPSSNLVVVPSVKFATFFDGHSFGHVERFVGKRSYVGLVLRRIEQSGKVSFLEFGEPEGLGEIAEWHLKERERIYEPYGRLLVRVRKLEHFPTVSNLFNLSLVGGVP